MPCLCLVRAMFFEDFIWNIVVLGKGIYLRGEKENQTTEQYDIFKQIKENSYTPRLAQTCNLVKRSHQPKADNLAKRFREA